MHDRRIKGKTLSFGHAGILYRNSFVMYDRETESLWVHVTGEAAHGPRKGWRLETLPASVTTWAEWKRDHPDTTVLPGYRRQGFMGHYGGTQSPRGMGLSTIVNFKAKLYPFTVLAGRQVVNDAFNGANLLIAYGRENGTAKAWNRSLEGVGVLEFERVGGASAGKSRGAANTPFLVQDMQTGSYWSWMTGEAVEGKLKGRKLASVAHHPILNKRFDGFYPDGPVYE